MSRRKTHHTSETARINDRLDKAARIGRLADDHDRGECETPACNTCQYLGMHQDDIPGVVSLRFDAETRPSEVLDSVCQALRQGTIDRDRAREIHREHVERLKENGLL
jgi:hypothetical protein